MQSSITHSEEKINHIPLSSLEHSSYLCDHSETEVRIRVIADGSEPYYCQCLLCGQAVGSAIAKTSIDGIPPSWNDQLAVVYDAFREKVFAAAKAVMEERESRASDLEAERKRQYKEYLKTDKWRDKRNRVLDRDKHLCQGCLKRAATQVHHLTYKNIGNEPLFELISVCSVCHCAIHEGVDNE
jgi:hypothetical protein